jgi:SAM-dependent methyltransferase
VPQTLDTEGEAFLAAAMRRSHRTLALKAHRLLTLCLSDFDANGLLGMYPMFLLSTPQALALLELASPPPVSERHLLDVGAGSGDVTTRLVPLVESVTCTEPSRFMARALRRRGFDVWHGACGQQAPGDPLMGSERYNIVAVFNVIDRCRNPRSLLASVVSHLPPGGILLLSTPLPFRAFFYDGSTPRNPEEALEVHADGWEEALSELWRDTLAPLGLEACAVSRVPYLSGGDAQHAAYVLDAAVLACRKPLA